MLTEYITKALQHAGYKQLEDKSWFGEISGFKGVWANADNIEDCRKELIEVLEEWLFLKISHQDPIPPIDGASLKIKNISDVTQNNLP